MTFYFKTYNGERTLIRADRVELVEVKELTDDICMDILIRSHIGYGSEVSQISCMNYCKIAHYKVLETGNEFCFISNM